MVSIYLGGDELPGEDELAQILRDIDLTDEELEAHDFGFRESRIA
jgi:hypothetical protein